MYFWEWLSCAGLKNLIKTVGFHYFTNCLTVCAGDIKGKSENKKKALKMTSQMVIFRAFFRPLTLNLKTKSCKSTNKKSGLKINSKLCTSCVHHVSTLVLAPLYAPCILDHTWGITTHFRYSMHRFSWFVFKKEQFALLFIMILISYNVYVLISLIWDTIGCFLFVTVEFSDRLLML